MTAPNQLLMALRKATATVLIVAFVALLGLAPWQAAQTEFPGHEHPPGTPEHTHQLELVTGWYALSTMLVTLLLSLPFTGRVYEIPRSWTERAYVAHSYSSRAPPYLAPLIHHPVN